MSAVKKTSVPAALWTGPWLKYLLAEGCSRDWGHRWPAPGRRRLVNSETIKGAFQLLHFVLFHLSSLGDLACGCFLLHFSLPVPGFLQGPLPGQHGFDGLFDRPAINLLVLRNGKKVQ